MTDISRRQMLGGAAALLLGSVFRLPPEQADAMAAQVVPEAPDVPTFVVRGTRDEPRISLEGELGGGKLGGVWFNVENHYAPFYDASGVRPLHEFKTGHTLTIKVTTPFALLDERSA